MNRRKVTLKAILLAGLLVIPCAGAAQEIEPGVYANTPVGLNYLAVGYSYSNGNIFMDPSLPIEDLDGRVNIALMRYIRTFNLVVPTGEYDSSKLINLGSNRWAFHSEFGLSKTWGGWTLEGAAGAWFYSDNDDFYGGSELSQYFSGGAGF